MAKRKQSGEPARAIFLSYASQDADAAGRICAALRNAGFEVWFGLGERNGVEPGVRVNICAENGQPICDAVVQRVDTENGMALADARAERLPRGAVVALRGSSAKQKPG